MRVKETFREMAIRSFANLTPFSAGAYALDSDAPFRAALSENLYGPSPLAHAAGIDEMSRIQYYPNSDNEPLTSDIANFYGLQQSQVVIGNGADEILLMIALACAGPGAVVGTTARSFGGHASSIELAGCVLREIFFDIGYDESELIAALPELDMLILANPHNPTGDYISSTSVRTLLVEAQKHDCIVVLDEAYAEFADALDFESGVGLLSDAANLIVVRTFSKAYGLAGLRCGYAMASAQIIDALRVARNSLPYNVNRVALAAASAALRDQAHLELVIERTRADLRLLTSVLREQGVVVLASQANFVLARLGEDCQSIVLSLEDHGFVLRDAAAMGYPGWARIGAMPDDGVRRLAALLREIREPGDGAINA